MLNENKELKIAPTRGPQVGQVLLNQAGPRGHPRKFRGRTQRPGPNFPGHNEGATRAANQFLGVVQLDVDNFIREVGACRNISGEGCVLIYVEDTPAANAIVERRIETLVKDDRVLVLTPVSFLAW